MTAVHLRKGTFGQKDREGHVKSEAETGVKHTQAKENQDGVQTPEALRVCWTSSSLRTPRRD